MQMVLHHSFRHQAVKNIKKRLRQPKLVPHYNPRIRGIVQSVMGSRTRLTSSDRVEIGIALRQNGFGTEAAAPLTVNEIDQVTERLHVLALAAEQARAATANSNTTTFRRTTMRR